MRSLRTYWLRHRQPTGNIGCLVRRKRFIVWPLFLTALTAAWISNSSFTVTEITYQYYVRNPEDSYLLRVSSLLSKRTGTVNETSVPRIYETQTTHSVPSTEYGTPTTSQPTTTANAEASHSETFSIFNVVNFTFLHQNTTACQGASMITIVQSAVAHLKQREVIRKTYGKGHPVFFMMGYDPSMNNTSIDEESARYKDIIQGSFVDSYRNLTYKHVMGLHWAHKYCPNTSIVLKVDDDVYANLELVEKYVEEVYNLSSSSVETNCSNSLMLCDIAEDKPVFRKDDSKWKVTREEYQPDRYPTYCHGWTTIYSRKAISCLLEQVSNVPYFWIEDVYVTGLVAKAASVKHTQINRFKFGPDTSYFKDKLSYSALEEFARKAIIGPYNLSLEELEYMGGIVQLIKSRQ